MMAATLDPARGRTFLAVAVVSVLLPSRSWGYIESLISMKEILQQSTHVLTGRIESVDVKKRRAVVLVERALKGRQDFGRVQMNLGVGDKRQAQFLLQRWRVGDPFILFYKKDGRRLASCGHAGDTWFQFFGDDRNPRSKVWWRFTHIEVYLPRTYNGSTRDLIRLTADVLAGKAKPPRPNPKAVKFDLRKAARSPAARDVRARSPQKDEVVLPRGSAWRYLEGRRRPPSAWRGSDFRDAAWKRGRAPFGYGDGPFGTALGDMRKQGREVGYTSLCLRRTIDLGSREEVSRLTFLVDYDDGFVLWLNGREVASANKPARLAHDSLASGNHESGTYERFQVRNLASCLVDGQNTLAAQVFNVNATSSDLKFDVEAQAVRRAARRSGFHRQLTFPAGGNEPRGLSWVDVDGNEALDLLVCRGGGNLLLINDGAGGFENQAARYGVGYGCRAGSWADYNGDDHPDLLTHDFRLFTHGGDQLRDDSKLIAVHGGRNPEGAGWIDFDGDGLPDILVTNGEHGIRLFRNTGRGPKWFREVSDRAGLGGRSGALGKGNGDFVAFSDYSGDGYTDFLYNLGSGVLARNEGNGTFTADTEAGIDLPGGDRYKRGTVFADYDNDGDVDLFVPAPDGRQRPRLYRNEGDGTFVDVTERSGALARERPGSFAAAWGDVNHDGFLDLFVCHPAGPSRMYVADGERGFEDVTETTGLGRVQRAFAASFADVDGDGDLDLAASTETGVVLAYNDLSKVPKSGSLRVRLHVRKGAIGAVVRVFDVSSRPRGLRELNGAESCGGQSSPVAHFGLAHGEYLLSVALSDGRAAQRRVSVRSAAVELVLREGEFE